MRRAAANNSRRNPQDIRAALEVARRETDEQLEAWRLWFAQNATDTASRAIVLDASRDELTKLILQYVEDPTGGDRTFTISRQQPPPPPANVVVNVPDPPLPAIPTPRTIHKEIIRDENQRVTGIEETTIGG
jgi:hypothetical protein